MNETRKRRAVPEAFGSRRPMEPPEMHAAARDRFRTHEALSCHGRAVLRADALAIAAAALTAADPVAALGDLISLEGETLVVRGARWSGLLPPAVESAHTDGQRGAEISLADRRVVVLGAGKATIGMAALLDELLGARIAAGCVVVKHGQGRRLRHIEVIEAAHPLPDDGSLRGGRRLLELAQAVGPDDLILGLVTGGSSALAVVPAEGLCLEDKIAANRVLLTCGADIVAINNVRKHLSQIKGGRLARACGCEIVNLTVSDVVGDPLDCLTDLLVPDRSTWGDAWETCDRFALWDRLPAAVVARLRAADPADETPKDLPGISTWVVADAAQMCAAAAQAAERLGYAARIVGLDLEGEASEAGRMLAGSVVSSPARTCLVAGGENTVTLAATTGRAAAGRAVRERLAGPTRPAVSDRDDAGAGGPSQEAALAGSLVLGRAGETACLLCLDSDGTDGPTEAAGGLIDDLSAAAAVAAGVDVSRALAAHEAGAALAAMGDLVVTGPTGTNVNDLKVALRGG